ncbi:hypothetical protein GCM10010349_73680 [Streptomyces flavofungini]|nr:hypothetical protein GCM10010349_73680 [Streptomyces flavofungini]
MPWGTESGGEFGASGAGTGAGCCFGICTMTLAILPDGTGAHPGGRGGAAGQAAGHGRARRRAWSRGSARTPATAHARPRGGVARLPRAPPRCRGTPGERRELPRPDTALGRRRLPFGHMPDRAAADGSARSLPLPRRKAAPADRWKVPPT